MWSLYVGVCVWREQLTFPRIIGVLIKENFTGDLRLKSAFTWERTIQRVSSKAETHRPQITEDSLMYLAALAAETSTFFGRL